MDALWVFETLTIVDLLDILLLSFLIYKVLGLLKGTRAFQSLFGLTLLALLYLLSGLLEVSAFYWIMDKVFVYIVLVILILFQDDFRRGLARAGDFLPRSGKQGNSVAQEVIIKTAYGLAARRIGALIVVEGDGSLKEYTQQGTQLDAWVSGELLRSIFFPTSPMHDGAVVISGDRVIAAQCFLPLSRRKDLPKNFGTRHLAAIGLTEITDAKVIVVSEERGLVSLVTGGSLQLSSDINHLRRLLELEEEEQ